MGMLPRWWQRSERSCELSAISCQPEEERKRGREDERKGADILVAATATCSLPLTQPRPRCLSGARPDLPGFEPPLRPLAPWRLGGSLRVPHPPIAIASVNASALFTACATIDGYT